MMFPRIYKFATGGFLACALLAAATSSASSSSTALFDPPVMVTIRGYEGDAMEPFITRDGMTMFFNNLNEDSQNTDLHYATKLDRLTFQYLGRVGGVNTDALEGVPTMDQSGNLFFTSPRSYAADKSTIFTGKWSQAGVLGVHLLQGDVSRHKTFWFNMDSEVSSDGQTLYFTDNHKPLIGSMDISELVVAHRTATGSFMRDPDSAKILGEINSKDDLDYAAGVSGDELELYFTRARPDEGKSGIYVATRLSKNAPFGQPEKIDAIQGFAEGPTVAPGDCDIYFHQKSDGRFRLFLAHRHNCRAS